MILSLPLYMFVVDDDAFAVLKDFLSAPRFLVLVFLSAGEEFQVGVLAPEGVSVEKIFLGEDLQPLVVAVLCHLQGKLLVIHQSGKHCFTNDKYSQETKKGFMTSGWTQEIYSEIRATDFAAGQVHAT